MFLFDLDVHGLNPDRCRELERACQAADHWPVEYVPGREERRWFGIRKAFPPTLELARVDAGVSALPPANARLADEGDTGHVPIASAARSKLARTIVAVGSVAADGFTLRVARADAPVRAERTLSGELAGLVEQDGLDGHTRYVVPPRLGS